MTDAKKCSKCLTEGVTPGKYGWIVTTRNHRFEVTEEEGGSCFVARFRDITKATEVAAQANEALALGGMSAGLELVKSHEDCVWWMDPPMRWTLGVGLTS